MVDAKVKGNYCPQHLPASASARLLSAACVYGEMSADSATLPLGHLSLSLSLALSLSFFVSLCVSPPSIPIPSLPLRTVRTLHVDVNVREACLHQPARALPALPALNTYCSTRGIGV